MRGVAIESVRALHLYHGAHLGRPFGTSASKSAVQLLLAAALSVDKPRGLSRYGWNLLDSDADNSA